MWHSPLSFHVESSCGDCAQPWSLPTSTPSGKSELPATLRRPALPLWSTPSPFSVIPGTDPTSRPSALSVGSPFPAGPPLSSDILLPVSSAWSPNSPGCCFTHLWPSEHHRPSTCPNLSLWTSGFAHPDLHRDGTLVLSSFQFLPQVKLAARPPHYPSDPQSSLHLSCFFTVLFPSPGVSFSTLAQARECQFTGTCSVKLHNQMRGFQSRSADQRAGTRRRGWIKRAKYREGAAQVQDSVRTFKSL